MSEQHMSWTNADERRLQELEQLEEDGAPLGAVEYAEWNDLLNRENASFIAKATGGAA